MIARLTHNQHISNGCEAQSVKRARGPANLQRQIQGAVRAILARIVEIAQDVQAPLNRTHSSRLGLCRHGDAGVTCLQVL